MTLDFNVAPYYDDYETNAKEQYYRILFRPSVALQARELTQLQSTLQNQITQFANHTFEDGAMVIPGQTALDKEYGFIKVGGTYNSADVELYRAEFLNTIITGQTTGVTAKVVGTAANDGTDPITLFVKYTSSGTDKVTKQFAQNEVVTSNASTPRSAQIDNVSGSVGFGSAANIQPGVYYVNGTFAFVTTQTLVLDKYTNTPSYRIGLTVTESIISSTEDSNLNDNAAGSPNFAAPGANRYKIELTLAKKSLTDTTDQNFIELIRVNNGVISKHVRSTDYSVLEDTFARRTYDESGDYTVRPFGIDIREHLLNGNNRGIYTSANGGADSKLAVGLEPGKAYVRGYEIEKVSTTFVDVDKARDTEQVVNSVVSYDLGNYTLVNTTTNVPDINTYELLDLISSGSTVIGTARARAYELHSGTPGTTAAVYKLYLFDIQMTGSNTFGSVNTINVTGSASGKFASTTVKTGGLAVIYNIANNDLLFPLSYQTVETIRAADGSIDTTITVRRVYTQTLSSGLATITAGSDESFQTPYTGIDYVVANSNTGTVYDMSQSDGTGGAARLSISGTNSVNLNIDLTGAGLTTETLTVVATVVKRIAQEKQKTLVSNHNLNISTPNTTVNSHDLLYKADIYRLVAVYDSLQSGTNATTSDLDITSRYELDNGQRDNFYDVGRIKLKPGSPGPTGRILVVFDYFTHGAGDYFSVDSYTGQVDYANIPQYASTSTTYELRDVLDFRPRVRDDGTSFVNAGGTNQSGAALTEIGKIASSMIMDFRYYLPRKDKIYVDNKGNFKVLKGVSAANPAIPNDPDDGMVIYELALNPYTFDVTDVIPAIKDNKRYTMRDIGRLEKRINSLEYYTSLSLLEKETADAQILDSNNVDRFKSGFIVDPFYGHNVGNPKDPDYHISIDADVGEARPQFYESNVRLETQIAGTSSTYQKTGDVITLPYTEVDIIDQPFASGTENVNPYDIFQWVGQIDLTPSTDDWKETDVRPDLIIDNEGLFDVVNTLANEDGVLGTVWNEWETQWAGREIEIGSSGTQRSGRRLFVETLIAQQAQQSRTGVRTSVAPDTIQTSFGERVVDVRMVPFIRSRRIKFMATRFKPNTRLYPFFEDIAVGDFTNDITSASFIRHSTTPVDPEPNFNALRHPDLSASDITAGNNAIITDATGTAYGEFYIPNTANIRFRTGERLFTLADDPNNNNANITTSGRATYSATGIVNSTQEVSLRSPTLTQETVTGTQDTILTRQSTRTVGWVDPLAQTFLVDNPDGAFITSCDIFFSEKDLSIPVTLQIRGVVNGYPSPEILAFGEVVKQAVDVNTSTDATSATTFTFPSPIYLRQNVEYAICLLANSNAYRVYTAEIGQNSIGTTRRISTQPYAGVFFKSQNGSTWSADQTKDLKFKMKRAEFDITASGIIDFSNAALPVKPLEANPLYVTINTNKVFVKHRNHGMPTGSTVTIAGITADIGGIAFTQFNANHVIDDVEMDQYSITVASNATSTTNGGGTGVTASENKHIDILYPNIQQLIFPNTAIGYGIKTTSSKSLAGSENTYQKDTSYVSVIANENFYPTNPKMVASAINETTSMAAAKSLDLRATIVSTSTYLSPMIDLDRTSVFTVANRIDNPQISSGTDSGKNKVQDFLAETEPTGGSALAKYITRKVTLAQSSIGLRIIFAGNRPDGSFIEVYYKTQEAGAEAPFNSLNWVLATIDNAVSTTDDPTKFNDYEYTIDLTSAPFQSVAVKVVFKSQSSTSTPRIKDFRVIALGT
jgi:hypothetical protein